MKILAVFSMEMIPPILRYFMQLIIVVFIIIINIVIQTFTFVRQPPGHNLWDVMSPPFFTSRSSPAAMARDGPMTLGDGCLYLYQNASQLAYTYNRPLPIAPSPSASPTVLPSNQPLSQGDSLWPSIEPSESYSYYSVEY